MRHLRFLVIVLFISSCFQKKTETIDYKTIVFNLNTSKDFLDYYNWKMKYLKQQNQITIDTLFSKDSLPLGVLFYQDNDYKVYGNCNGEFGGELMFQDRHKTDSIYYLESTCPIMIDRRSEGYYITESLAHGNGSGKIQFLTSPKELINVHLDSLSSNWKKEKFPNLNRHELCKNLENQGQILIDTMGLTFNIFFSFNDKNYLIYSDLKNTYLGHLISGHLVTIDTLLNVPTWSHSDSPNDIINNFYHYNFNRVSGIDNGKIYIETTTSGDIFVRNDTIVIAYKERMETNSIK